MTSTTTRPTFDQATIAAAVLALTQDGDVYELPDGRELRLVVERDDGNPMDQFGDCYGKVEWSKRDRDTGRDIRPAGFTGAARKFRLNGYALEGTVWWEPERDGHTVYDDPDTVAFIRGLLEDGFQQVGVKLYERVTDSLGHAHTIKVAESWLGGIDSLEDGYLAEVVRERIEELA